MSNRRTRTTILITVLALVLVIGGWFLIQGPKNPVVNSVVNSDARGYASQAIGNVVGGASETSIAEGGSGSLTKASLAAAISNEDAGAAVDGRPAVILRAVTASRATFTVNTPQEKNMCAWVPLSYKGLLYAWPVHFC